jgi:hypothetical protein
MIKKLTNLFIPMITLIIIGSLIFVIEAKAFTENQNGQDNAHESFLTATFSLG